jgi:hypothetical protein
MLVDIIDQHVGERCLTDGGRPPEISTRRAQVDLCPIAGDFHLDVHPPGLAGHTVDLPKPECVCQKLRRSRGIFVKQIWRYGLAHTVSLRPAALRL